MLEVNLYQFRLPDAMTAALFCLITRWWIFKANNLNFSKSFLHFCAQVTAQNNSWAVLIGLVLTALASHWKISYHISSHEFWLPIFVDMGLSDFLSETGSTMIHRHGFMAQSTTCCVGKITLWLQGAVLPCLQCEFYSRPAKWIYAILAPALCQLVWGLCLFLNDLLQSLTKLPHHIRNLLIM